MSKNNLFLPLFGCLLMSFTMLPLPDQPKGVERSFMDLQVKPADDFFSYANGSWLKNNPIPPSEPAWGAFNELQERNNALVRNIIEEAALAHAPAGSIKQKVGDYYGAVMDTIMLEKAGITPIREDLKKIELVKDANGLMRLQANQQQQGIASLFFLYVTQDQKKSDEYICYLNQSGLGLPDRDYYLKDDKESVKIRTAYKAHIEAIFKLAGNTTPPQKASEVVMELETDLAKASMTNVELRDDEKQYNKYAYADLTKSFSAINWDDYFKAAGVGKINNIIISQPDFIKKINEMLVNVPVSKWKIYFTWCLLNEASDKLNAAFERQNFSFYGTTLSGTKEMKPRWKRAVSSTNGALGEAVGQLYVEKAFSPESKKRVNELVDNLLEAYKERINGLDWMSDITKQKALIKLAAFSRKLGYPDKWKDYSTLTITKESYYKNAVNANIFRYNQMINKLGKPIDKTEWGLSPQTVNAYYNPQNNEIVFPAAIMQPPFFNPDVDDAINYGAIGSVIGHEITHGFDDQGSRYDQNGNLLDWWTAEDREKFDKRAQKLVDQFNGYKVFDDLNINGQLTLGENIADLGGLTMAYNAYQRAVSGKPRVDIDGFTPEQRFFLGWAQVWRSNYRPEALRRQVLTNVHSPDNFRAIGAPTNLPEFYSAFGIKPGDKMYRDENNRVKVW